MSNPGETKYSKQQRLKSNRECVESMAGIIDFVVVRIQDFHLRLTNPVDNRKLDYFPQSGKASWTGTGKWFTIDNIEDFLNNNFIKQP
jgi:hypothetical protein